MGSRFVLIELIACVSSRVKSFELASGMKFFGEAISFVGSRFVHKVMFVDWSVDRHFLVRVQEMTAV